MRKVFLLLSALSFILTYVSKHEIRPLYFPSDGLMHVFMGSIPSFFAFLGISLLVFHMNKKPITSKMKYYLIASMIASLLFEEGIQVFHNHMIFDLFDLIFGFIGICIGIMTILELRTKMSITKNKLH